MLKKFDKDVIITWSKVLCTICGEPTGKKSKCYNLPQAKEIEDSKKLVSFGKSGLLPIYRTNCAFRENNLWQVSLNYPVSLLLLDDLLEVEGITEASAIDKYKARIIIADDFDEQDVKKMAGITIRGFFKELHAFETEMSDDVENIQGIEFPNGNRFVVGGSEDEKSIEQLGNEFPNAKVLKKEKEKEN